MNILKLIGKVFRFHPSNPSYWAKKFWGMPESESGVQVDEETALKYGAVYACVRVLAETIASLPLNVYKRLEPKGKDKDSKHNLYNLLHSQPNGDMTSFTWRELAMAHLLLWGNHYSLTPRDGYQKVTSIIPMVPWRVKPERVMVDGRKVKVYRYQPEEGAEVVLGQNDVLHIPGLSFDGLVGLSPLGWYREQIGLGLAMQTYSSKFFANGTHSSGIFTTPQALKPETRDRLEKDLAKKYKGLGKSHNTMLLEQELKFEKLSVNPDDAQLLESKKFQIEEIARIFRVPLHLLQNLDRSTNNNIEHQSIDFVVHSVRPWLVRFEQAINTQLFTYDSKTHFAEFVVDGLLRGDSESRFRAYSIAVQNGIFSPNDVLELENRNPYPGGDKHFIQLNMQPIESIGQPVQDQRSLKIETIKPRAIEDLNLRSAQTRKRLSDSYKPLIANVATRIIKRETVDILKEAKSVFKTRSNTTGFYQYLDDYYQEHQDFITKHSEPVFYDLGKAIAVEAAAEVGYQIGTNDNIDKFLKSYSQAYTLRHSREHKERIIKVIEKGLENNIEPYEMLEVEFQHWEEEYPGQIADRQAVKENGAVSRLVYGSAGITKLVWRNTGNKSCPYCENLNGKVVGISEPFFLKGQGYMPEGAKSSLNFGSDIIHPPLHTGCVCTISPSV